MPNEKWKPTDLNKYQWAYIAYAVAYLANNRDDEFIEDALPGGVVEDDVFKVCHNKSGEVDPDKVVNLDHLSRVVEQIAADAAAK